MEGLADTSPSRLERSSISEQTMKSPSLSETCVKSEKSPDTHAIIDKKLRLFGCLDKEALGKREGHQLRYPGGRIGHLDRLAVINQNAHAVLAAVDSEKLRITRSGLHPPM
jgi:hypothetical protein